MKRSLIFALTLCLVLLPACGETVIFNTAADFPDGICTLSVLEVGEKGGGYYAVVSPTDGSGARLTFRLAEDFAAWAFEPGADGALYMLDYSSPADFCSQWYQLARQRGALGTLFEFIFAGDELVHLADISDPSPPDGPQAWVYEELPEGVAYREDFTWEGDPGEGLSAPEAAVLLFNAAIGYHEYMPGEAYTIVMTGFEFLEDGECYAYTFETPDGESKHAVNYFTGAVYVCLDGEWLSIGEAPLDMEGLTEEQAMHIASIMLQAQLNEGAALVYKGEGEVNGRRAFLIDLGMNTEEKFTAEEHYAVTDDGEVWLLDILANEWQPAAAG
jgi:hypothetical protein